MMMYNFAKRTIFATLLSLIVIMAGCSDDHTEHDQVTCSAGERLNPISNLCEPDRSENLPPGNDVGTDSDSQEHNDTDSGQDEDVSAPGNDADTAIPEQDSGPTDIGNHQANCHDIAEGHIDPEIICEFYAHTPDKLFLVDPFRKTAKEVMSLPGAAFDIDMHTNGTLYLVADNVLSSLAPDTTSWIKEGDIEVGNPNGLCLDMGGGAFITSMSDLFSFDLDNKQLIGPIGGKNKLKPHSSSGDCVINKGNVLYMSSNTGPTDDLVQIDSETGASVKIGNIGFTGVYGLTAAWGRLYGLTGAGELIEINSQTGRGTLIHKFNGKVWNGAASTPQR